MKPQDFWYWIHENYGGNLGLTSDDEDYVEPSCNIPGTQYLVRAEDNSSCSADSCSVSDSGRQRDKKNKKPVWRLTTVQDQCLSVEDISMKKSFSVPDIIVEMAHEVGDIFY